MDLSFLIGLLLLLFTSIPLFVLTMYLITITDHSTLVKYHDSNTSYKLNGKYYSRWYIELFPETFGKLITKKSYEYTLNFNISDVKDINDLEEIKKLILKREKRNSEEVTFHKIEVVPLILGVQFKVNYIYGISVGKDELKSTLDFPSLNYNISKVDRNNRKHWKNSIEENRILSFYNFLKLKKNKKYLEELYNMDEDIKEFQDYYGLKAKTKKDDYL